jgi:D-aminopeptidase
MIENTGSQVEPGRRPRAREIGLSIGRLVPGKWNAITDVAGIRVGHTTLIEGEGSLVVGKGPVRTGVTVVVPHEGTIAREPLFGGSHVLNGNGEMTGLAWLNESGLLTSPVALTNTHSVGVVRDALIQYEVERHAGAPPFDFSLPVVAETYDGWLSDINGMHVKAEHVFRALVTAASGPVSEGCVGSGTGMICHGFKGGIGTASRTLSPTAGGWTVGVLVQANHGQRALLRIDGVPVGREIDAEAVPVPYRTAPPGAGSIIVLIATDAPVLPTGCRRLAQRATVGIARVGGLGENGSGDIFLAFSTAGRGQTQGGTLQALGADAMTPLFEAVADATEEAIVNALCAATTMTGIDGHTAYALPLDRLEAVLRHYRRLPE